MKDKQTDQLYARNIKFFKQNKVLYQAKYSGKVVLIAQGDLKGVFDNIASAYEEAIKKFELGEFICQLVDYDKPENALQISGNLIASQ